MAENKAEIRKGEKRIYFTYDMTEKFNYTDVTDKEGKMRSTRTKRKECDEFPIELTKNYSESLPISEAKKKDLLNLVKNNIIPEELEDWY